MMTIGIPTVQFKPAPAMFYVPNTRVTRAACLAYALPEKVVDLACGGTWPIHALEKSAVCAPVACAISDFWFPLEAVQLL